MYEVMVVNLTRYDLRTLVKNGEVLAVGTEKQCEKYAETQDLGTYQINYLDEE